MRPGTRRRTDPDVSEAREHARLSRIQHDRGELLIAGERLSELAGRVGSTPFYAYDRDLVAQRVDDLRKALPEPVQLHYAIKANPQRELVAQLAALVDGFDVASAGEMRIALDSGMSAPRIGFAGPGKRIEELRAAMAAGVRVSVESLTEMNRIATIAAETGAVPRLSIRVNPDFELKRSGAKMGGYASQFGIDVEQVPAVVAAARAGGLTVDGLHIYAGSQNLDAGAIGEANRLSLQLASELAAQCELELASLNIGGGFGIPYFENERDLDIAAVGAALGESMAAHAGTLRGTQIIVELGRYLVGEAGYYVTRVLDIKTSRGECFAVVDGGLHHHLANSGNFGQVLRKNYPVVVGNKLNDAADGAPVSIVGPLCTPLDIVAKNVVLPRLDIGDLIVVLQSGAYGRSASPLGFLGHPPPAEILAGV
jgi:diaminopimelate decarboxylase